MSNVQRRRGKAIAAAFESRNREACTAGATKRPMKRPRMFIQALLQHRCITPPLTRKCIEQCTLSEKRRETALKEPVQHELCVGLLDERAESCEPGERAFSSASATVVERDGESAARPGRQAMRARMRIRARSIRAPIGREKFSSPRQHQSPAAPWHDVSLHGQLQADEDFEQRQRQQEAG